MDFTYETEFENVMEDYFLSKYGLWGNTLQEYLILRYMIINNQKDYKKITIEDFSKFIAQELGIINLTKFTYRGTEFYVNSATTQSISNIIQNMRPTWNVIWSNFHIPSLDYMFNKDYSELVRGLPVKIRKSKSKNKKYLKDNFLLGVLNFNFGVEPDFVSLENVEELSPGVRTYEEVCEAYAKLEVFDTYDVTQILEKDIEDYLYKNLKELFNIDPVQRQYSIAPDCIADILAKDSENFYIVELKNAKDQRLLWQLVNYHRHMPNAKLIAASTYWGSDILEEILKLGYVETYSLRPHISMGKIDNLEVLKLS